ncbi:F-box protein 34 [Phyllostomus discolor]|uniref:F-box protein 34 n=1 Tax=Phyllostomus discolor TaxID=89673 RepID=A0A834A5N9_9CHIR|nr:F-box protein 34 [Phyllostomus discolor]
MYQKCWKWQNKVHPLKISEEALRTPMSHQEAIKDKEYEASQMKESVFPPTSPGKVSSQNPFEVLPPDVLYSISGKSPVESSLNVKTKKNAPSAIVHQGEGEGSCDTRAVLKLANTKEKAEFFPAHQSSNRVGRMKIKSSKDIDGRATKRGKQSGNRKAAKIQLEKMREIYIRCMGLSLVCVALSTVFCIV